MHISIIKNQETQQILADMVDSDNFFVAAKGGNGGFGNSRFKTHKNPAPRRANEGQKGEEKSLELELKVLVSIISTPDAR